LLKPSVIVVDDEPANRAFVRNVLTAAGWIVTEAEGGVEAVAMAQAAPPHLIVMDIDMPDLDGWATTAAIRASAPPASGVPILAYTTMRVDDAEVHARGLDGRLPKPCPPDELAAAVARWRPDGEVSRALKLGEIFGHEEIAKLVARFHEQLIDALADIDADRVDIAHRIAGVAGTLGFADVSSSWQRLSEGDPTAKPDARRDARVAIARIERDFPAA
jgi:CheY-like chemotaxis protein